jgi:hypothetical protein
MSSFGSLFLNFVILYISKQYEKSTNFKEKVKQQAQISYRLKVASSFVASHVSTTFRPNLRYESISYALSQTGDISKI